MDDSPEQIIDTLSTRLVSDFIDTVTVLEAVVQLNEKYYESSHSRWVADKSEAVARYLGFDEQTVFLVRTAAALHDIGKISLPDSLLPKFVSGMDERDLALYKNHPQIGYQILSQHEGLKEVAEVVYQHHEHLDGSGFPRRLKGDQIHKAAAVIGPVNLYHNVMFRRTTHRHEAMSSTKITSSLSWLSKTEARHLQIVTYLEKKSGSHYHPKIVAALLAILENERKGIGEKSARYVPVSQLTTEMILAESYYTAYGLLIASSGEHLTEKIIDTFRKFFETGQLPAKILVMV